MADKAYRLTSSQQAESAGVRMFNQIDRKVSRYIESAESSGIREQAMRNAVAMLDILMRMYQNDLKLYSHQRYSERIALRDAS